LQEHDPHAQTVGHVTSKGAAAREVAKEKRRNKKKRNVDCITLSSDEEEEDEAEEEEEDDEVEFLAEMEGHFFGESQEVMILG